MVQVHLCAPNRSRQASQRCATAGPLYAVWPLKRDGQSRCKTCMRCHLQQSLFALASDCWAKSKRLFSDSRNWVAPIRESRTQKRAITLYYAPVAEQADAPASKAASLCRFDSCLAHQYADTARRARVQCGHKRKCLIINPKSGKQKQNP